jgi:hypothetical protein
MGAFSRMRVGHYIQLWLGSGNRAIQPTSNLKGGFTVQKEVVNLIEILAFMGFAVILMMIAMVCFYFDAKYGSKDSTDEAPKKRELPQTRSFTETEGGEIPRTKNANLRNLPSKISSDFKHSLERFFDE